MNLPPETHSPLVEAMRWVSRITVVALEMVLPGLGGQWLDRQLGTEFLVLIGFAFGLTGGMWHLLVMTGAVRTGGGDPDTKKEKERER